MKHSVPCRQTVECTSLTHSGATGGMGRHRPSPVRVSINCSGNDLNCISMHTDSSLMPPRAVKTLQCAGRAPRSLQHGRTQQLAAVGRSLHNYSGELPLPMLQVQFTFAAQQPEIDNGTSDLEVSANWRGQTKRRPNVIHESGTRYFGKRGSGVREWSYGRQITKVHFTRSRIPPQACFTQSRSTLLYSRNYLPVIQMLARLCTFARVNQRNIKSELTAHADYSALHVLVMQCSHQFSLAHRVVVAERLACPPPTKAKCVQSPAGTPGFLHAGIAG
ncbi:hypothetical protein PR048_022951 [Dryococelus australis]|uniref:Uncharacterized protein n=1 Tax=Dryococelus australis TaxID=614101 RepID=A0ABQ9GSS7_9NEOP|nr:hypothetical protein PR048_022951 [Dryococelus australis]